MKLNDFRKLLKVKLNQCNIILIMLLLFVVLTYTSIVPYITNLLNLEKEQEIEEFRKKRKYSCVNGKPARNFNYVMGSHFGGNVKLGSRPQRSSYYTGKPLPLLKQGRARSTINSYAYKAKNNNYKNFSPNYMKKNFTKENRQLLCNNYSKWNKDMRDSYSIKLPPRHRRGSPRVVMGPNAKQLALYRSKELKPCLWDAFRRKKTKDTRRMGLRQAVSTGGGGMVGRTNRAFNVCSEIQGIKEHPLNEKYSRWYDNDKFRKYLDNRVRYDKKADRIRIKR